MFGSVILDVAVGLILVYLLFSLVSASIREWLAAREILAARGLQAVWTAVGAD